MTDYLRKDFVVVYSKLPDVSFCDWAGSVALDVSFTVVLDAEDSLTTYYVATWWALNKIPDIVFFFHRCGFASNGGVPLVGIGSTLDGAGVEYCFYVVNSA